jgi:hypothetical protein
VRGVEVEGIRAGVLDFVGVRGRGDVMASRRAVDEPLAKTLDGELDADTLAPFRIAELVESIDDRGTEETFSRSGGAPCGGVEGRDRDVRWGGDSESLLQDWLAKDNGGGTVMEIKVSTRRDVMTFSSPLCELSGSIAEKDMEPVEEKGTATEGACT